MKIDITRGESYFIGNLIQECYEYNEDLGEQSTCEDIYEKLKLSVFLSKPHPKAQSFVKWFKELSVKKMEEVFYTYEEMRNKGR